MRRLADIAKQRDTMKTLLDLTSVFQGIASMRITQVKSQIGQSQDFFDQLWNIYSQIRIDGMFRFGHIENSKFIDKELVLVIASEGGLSGEIDRRTIAAVEKYYKPERNDLIVIGRHGGKQLLLKGIKPKKVLRLPEEEQYINAIPIMEDVQLYGSTVVFYQKYISLTDQQVTKVDLGKEIIERGKKSGTSGEAITDKNYIFEPSTVEVLEHLEQSMMNIAISQIILESKLSQFAARFQNMSLARDKAEHSFKDYRRQYYQVKRYVADERLKEIIYSYKKVGA